jgi:hypothetical protein
LPLNVHVDDYIGRAARRGLHNMKILTEASAGGVFTPRHEEDLPRIVQTIGLGRPVQIPSELRAPSAIVWRKAIETEIRSSTRF